MYKRAVDNKMCSADGCNLKLLAKGYCSKHYYRMKRHGSLILHYAFMDKCTAVGCENNQITKKLCKKHYAKILNSGTLEYLHLYDGKAKERNRARTAKWKKDNWEYYKAYLNSRKAHVKIATPRWLSKDERKKITEFYRECPKGYHVDHIIPLRGKTFPDYMCYRIFNTCLPLRI